MKIFTHPHLTLMRDILGQGDVIIPCKLHSAAGIVLAAPFGKECLIVG